MHSMFFGGFGLAVPSCCVLRFSCLTFYSTMHTVSLWGFCVAGPHCCVLEIVCQASLWGFCLAGLHLSNMHWILFFENPVTQDHIVVCLKPSTYLALLSTMKSISSRQSGHGGLNAVLDSVCITLHSTVHSMLLVIRKLTTSDCMHSVTSTILYRAGSCMISMSSNLQGLNCSIACLAYCSTLFLSLSSWKRCMRTCWGGTTPTIGAFTCC